MKRAIIKIIEWAMKLAPYGVFGLIFVASRFWIADMQYGNTNVVILALCVGTVAADLRDRAWLAGLLLALAVTIKLTPVVLLGWFLARRRWRATARRWCGRSARCRASEGCAAAGTAAAPG